MSVQAALALLALFQKKATGPGGSITTVVNNLLEGHTYDREVWVDVENGSDVPMLGRGNRENPWKSVNGWGRTLAGAPTSRADWEHAYRVEVRGQNTVPSSPCILPRRRIAIHAPGVYLPAMSWTVDQDEWFGSPFPAELTIFGDPSGFIPNDPDKKPASMVQIGDGANALTILHAGVGAGNHLLNVENAFIKGSVLPAAAFGANGSVHTIRNTSIGGNNGSLYGPLVGSPIFMAELTNCILPVSLYTMSLTVLAEMLGGIVNSDIVLGAVPGAGLVRGAKGVNFLTASSVVGPAGAFYLDRVTDFFITTNGATVAGAVKTFIEA